MREKLTSKSRREYLKRVPLAGGVYSGGVLDQIVEKSKIKEQGAEHGRNLVSIHGVTIHDSLLYEPLPGSPSFYSNDNIQFLTVKISLNGINSPRVSDFAIQTGKHRYEAKKTIGNIHVTDVAIWMESRHGSYTSNDQQHPRNNKNRGLLIFPVSDPLDAEYAHIVLDYWGRTYRIHSMGEKILEKMGNKPNFNIDSVDIKYEGRKKRVTMEVSNNSKNTRIFKSYINPSDEDQSYAYETEFAPNKSDNIEFIMMPRGVPRSVQTSNSSSIVIKCSGNTEVSAEAPHGESR